MAEKQDPSNEGGSRNQQIRHDMVTTAANFLLNPSVINKPYEHKTAFLRKKGLTEAEISLAYEKAESDPRYKQLLQNSGVSNIPPVLPPPVPVYYKPISFWSRLSRFSSSLIVLGVAVFGVHYVYKKYIEPLIYGEEDKSKTMEKQILDLTDALSQLERHISSMEENITCQKDQMNRFLQNEVSEYCPTPVALRELKAEVTSVKSLLLNRHQFPALPKVSPTIPHWQLPSNENGDDNSKPIGDDNTSKQNGDGIENEHLSDEKISLLEQEPEFGLAENSVAVQTNGNDISETESAKHQYSEELSTDVEAPVF